MNDMLETGQEHAEEKVQAEEQKSTSSLSLLLQSLRVPYSRLQLNCIQQEQDLFEDFVSVHAQQYEFADEVRKKENSLTALSLPPSLPSHTLPSFSPFIVFHIASI